MKYCTLGELLHINDEGSLRTTHSSDMQVPAMVTELMAAERNKQQINASMAVHSESGPGTRTVALNCPGPLTLYEQWYWQRSHQSSSHDTELSRHTTRRRGSKMQMGFAQVRIALQLVTTYTTQRYYNYY